MMVSTKGRYALIVCLDLAQQDPEAYISLREVAQRQNISMKYLESIVAMLNRAGLVRSLRGKGGGYRLTRPPEACSVGEILQLTEGSMRRCIVWSLAAPVRSRSAVSPIPCGDNWIS